MYLQRHGESESNVTRVFTCRRLDPSLTETGRRQIGRKIPFFRRSGVRQIITSPSRRAVQSAEILGEALGAGVTTDDALLEVDIGDLEGKEQRDPKCLRVFLETLRDWLEGGKNTRFPGGESYEEVAARTQRVVSLGAPSTVLIGHATLFAVLMGKNGRQYGQVEDLFLPRAGTVRYAPEKNLWEIVKEAEPADSGGALPRA